MHTQGFLLGFLTMRHFISALPCTLHVPPPHSDALFYLLSLLLLTSYSLGIRNTHSFIINKQTLDPTSSGIFLNQTPKHNKWRL